MDGSQGMITIIFYLAVFAIMYFFFLKPNVNKRKAQEKFTTDVGKGSEIVTTSGIIGRINKIEGEIVHLQIDQKTFIKILRSAISKELTEEYLKKPVEKTNA